MNFILKECLQRQITADKREIKDFPKSRPLSRKRELKSGNIVIGISAV